MDGLLSAAAIRISHITHARHNLSAWRSFFLVLLLTHAGNDMYRYFSACKFYSRLRVHSPFRTYCCSTEYTRPIVK